MKKAVRIIETILNNDSGQDIKILPELIHMFGCQVKKFLIKGQTTREETLDHIFGGDERYIHISSHGSKDGFYIHGNRNVKIGAREIDQYCNSNGCKLGSLLKGKFLTVSACGDPSSSFWQDFHNLTGVNAIITSMGTVKFQDSAMFYAAFYFSLLRHPGSSEKATISQRVIDFVDAFQRTKGSFLSLGGNGAFRLCFWLNGEFKEII